MKRQVSPPTQPIDVYVHLDVTYGVRTDVTYSVRTEPVPNFS